MFCHNCGFKLPSASKFCSKCGTSLASLNEMPPQIDPPRPKTKPNFASYTPTVAKRGEGDDGDDDDIAVDRIQSISDLNLSLSSFEVILDVPPIAKETVGGLVRQGALSNDQGLSAPRIPSSTDSQMAINQLKAEGGSLRQK